MRAGFGVWRRANTASTIGKLVSNAGNSMGKPATKSSGNRIASVAKAGRRKPPAAKKGKHLTTPEDRKRARWLMENFGLKPYERPRAWYVQGAQG